MLVSGDRENVGSVFFNSLVCSQYFFRCAELYWYQLSSLFCFVFWSSQIYTLTCVPLKCEILRNPFLANLDRTKSITHAKFLFSRISSSQNTVISNGFWLLTFDFRLNCTSLDYPTTAKQAFALGPAPIQKFASFARWDFIFKYIY